MRLYVGCSGWSYSSWQGPFYPQNIDNRAWLPYYSQVFNYVEIDSTFYNTPSELMVKNWNRRTPENFRFTAKFPKTITHDKKFKNVDKDLELFYKRMEPIPKINRDQNQRADITFVTVNITRKENKQAYPTLLIKKSKVDETLRSKIKFKMIKSLIDICFDVC